MSSTPSFQFKKRAIYEEFIANHLPRHLIYIGKPEGDSSWPVTIKIIPGPGSSIYSYFETDLREIDDDQNMSEKQAIHRELKKRLKYAILSHRWYAEGEPLFKEMTENPNRSGKGFEKLIGFCQKARQEFGCKLAWSDTCCIDKNSSAELDEAIRSMFRWYREAYICMVHLAGASDTSFEELNSDEWFMRGWTLQELLAPEKIKFYGKNWKKLCDTPNDKENKDLLETMSRITHIPIPDLESFKPGTKDIRTRMSWASRRRTTRTEDLAYCLIGIFDVNLPIAYGEGDWAFYRLMEVIIQRCDEWGIFAWAGSPSTHGRTKAIAQSPECYKEICTEQFPDESETKVHGDTSFTLSRKGLQLRLMIAIGDIQKVDNSEHYEFTVKPSYASMTPDFDSIKFKVSTKLKMEGYEWAIGILNYRATGDPEEEIGKLEGDRDYVCFLLRRKAQDVVTAPEESKDWVKQQTDDILVLRTRFQTKLESREPLERLWL